MPTVSAAPHSRAGSIRVGFIALNDSAPIIVAHEHGFFRRYGLTVRLSREVGWATIRDKLMYRELDAAHSLGPMVISTHLGLGSAGCACLSPFILNANGNCITLSAKLWERGVRDAKTLAAEIVRARHEETFVFGVVFTHSSHHILLRDWLLSGGIRPERDVQIVVVPPPQLFRNLSAGTLDGYCVGDPWNSLAVREGAGWCPAVSADLAPVHPEKVFIVRKAFCDARRDDVVAMTAALREAAALCDRPEFRPDLAKLMARREYLNVPLAVTRAGLVGPFHYGHERYLKNESLIRFSGEGINDPTLEKAAWYAEGLLRHGLGPADAAITSSTLAKLFASDIYAEAKLRTGLA